MSTHRLPLPLLSRRYHADERLRPSFAPPGEKHSQTENISLVMKFFLGMHDLFHAPLPIWVAVESVVGTVRLRCQMVAKPPYIRNVTFTLMGVPAVQAVRPRSSPSLAVGDSYPDFESIYSPRSLSRRLCQIFSTCRSSPVSFSRQLPPLPRST